MEAWSAPSGEAQPAWGGLTTFPGATCSSTCTCRWCSDRGGLLLPQVLPEHKALRRSIRVKCVFLSRRRPSCASYVCSGSGLSLGITVLSHSRLCTPKALSRYRLLCPAGTRALSPAESEENHALSRTQGLAPPPPPNIRLLPHGGSSGCLFRCTRRGWA